MKQNYTSIIFAYFLPKIVIESMYKKFMNTKLAQISDSVL